MRAHSGKEPAESNRQRHGIGWWPIESLDYGEGVVIELRHGIVEANEVEGRKP